MSSPAEFAETYQHMSDGQLLQTAREDGLLPEAKQVLDEEIRRRNLKPGDLPNPDEVHHETLQEESKSRWLPWIGFGRTGFGLYGHGQITQADHRSNLLVRTRFFVLAGFPLIPRASFRFRYPSTAKKWYGWDDSYGHVVERIPIDWHQVFRVWLNAFLWIAGTITAIALYEWLKGHSK